MNISKSLYNSIYNVRTNNIKNMSDSDYLDIMQKINTVYSNEVYQPIFENHRFLTIIEKEGKIFASYLPKGKEAKFNNDNYDSWNKQNRIYTKVGKGIKTFFKDYGYDFSDNVIEYLNNQIKSKYNTAHAFKLVNGADIKKYYSGDRYEENQATLNSSCMRDDECQSYFSIYTDNANVKMLISLDEKTDLINGRALIWDNKFMDRIYGNDITIERFKRYANDNDLYHRQEQNYHSGIPFVNKNNDEIYNATIELNYSNFERYPYCDTFKYLVDGTLYMNDNYHGHDVKTLQNTDGYYEENEQYYCEWNDTHYTHEEDIEYSEHHGQTVPTDDEEFHRIGFDLIHEDDLTYSEYHGEYFISDDDDYITTDSGDFVNYENTIYVQDLDIHIADNEQNDYDVYICADSGDFYSVDVLVLVQDDYYHEDLLNDIFALTEDTEEYHLTDDLYKVNDVYFEHESNAMQYEKMNA